MVFMNAADFWEVARKIKAWHIYEWEFEVGILDEVFGGLRNGVLEGVVVRLRSGRLCTLSRSLHTLHLWAEWKDGGIAPTRHLL